LPQAPQLLRSLEIFAGLPLQFLMGGVSTNAWHCPSTQVVPLGQVLPSAPQLLSSEATATQLVLIRSWLTGQVSVQVPAEQVCPARQAVEQPPHWPNEDSEAQRSPQSWASSTRQEATQVPPMQLCVGGQCVPQVPQL
jgi:hypothetical protein